MRQFVTSFIFSETARDYVTFIAPSRNQNLCEGATWSPNAKEEHGLGEYTNRMLRGIFEPQRQDVTGSWKKLHRDELRNL